MSSKFGFGLILSLLLSVISQNTLAKSKNLSFKCLWKDHGKKAFVIKGKLDDKGGKLKMRGAYVFGTDKSQKVTFYRVVRKDEANFEYAKFSVKSPEQYEKKEWLTPFYRISLPKKILAKSTNKRKFTAYFGFHNIDSENEDSDILEELPALECKKKLL